MAYTLNQLRNEKQTSVFGRRLGLDRRNFLVGIAGTRKAIEDIYSSAPTTVGVDNVTRIRTSGSSQGGQHNLPAPVIGMRKVILMTSTSTGSQQFLSTPNGAAIFSSSLGTTVGVINFLGAGGGVVLRAVSGSEWAIEAIVQPAVITVTTST